MEIAVCLIAQSGSVTRVREVYGVQTSNLQHLVGRVRQDPLTGRPPMVGQAEFGRILIVDDNADLAEAMSMTLSMCGFQTTTAYNGRVALKKVGTFHPDIVLLDIGLPDMSGYELASVLRAKDDLATTVLIAISANEPDSRLAGVSDNLFDNYLVKPVDLDKLVQLLSNLDG